MNRLRNGPVIQSNSLHSTASAEMAGVRIEPSVGIQAQVAHTMNIVVEQRGRKNAPFEESSKSLPSVFL